jgi:hypothetical protein
LYPSLGKIEISLSELAYLDQLARAIQADLLCQLGGAHHLGKELINVGDGLGANGL